MAIEGASCPPYTLTMIHENQQLHLKNHQRYSDSFSEIGFDPKFESCKEWDASMRLFNGGKEYLATYTNTDTGEAWEITEKGDRKQTSEARDL
jgi:hypothetical protein